MTIPTPMPTERLSWFDPACDMCRAAWDTVALVCPEHNPRGRAEHVARHPPSCQCGLGADGAFRGARP